MWRATPVPRHAGLTPISFSARAACTVYFSMGGGGALPVSVPVLDRIAVGVPHRVLAVVGEYRLKAGLGAVPVHPLAEGRDRIVRKVEQRCPYLGIHVGRSVRTASSSVNERSSMAGAEAMRWSPRRRRARSRCVLP
jgi:hypothetical protein